MGLHIKSVQKKSYQRQRAAFKYVETSDLLIVSTLAQAMEGGFISYDLLRGHTLYYKTATLIHEGT